MFSRALSIRGLLSELNGRLVLHSWAQTSMQQFLQNEPADIAVENSGLGVPLQT